MAPTARRITATSGDRAPARDAQVNVTQYLALSICGMAIVFTGLVSGLSPGHADHAEMGWIVASLTASLAVAADARRRRAPMSHVGMMLLFIGPLLAGPVYLVRTRGLRGLAWTALFGLALVALLLGGVVLAMLVRLAR